MCAHTYISPNLTTSHPSTATSTVISHLGFHRSLLTSQPAPALVPTFRSSRCSQRCHSAPSSKARPRSLASCCSSSGHTDATGRSIPVPSCSRPCCPLPLHVSLCYAERLSPPSPHPHLLCISSAGRTSLTCHHDRRPLTALAAPAASLPSEHPPPPARSVFSCLWAPFCSPGPWRLAECLAPCEGSWVLVEGMEGAPLHDGQLRLGLHHTKGPRAQQGLGARAVWTLKSCPSPLQRDKGPRGIWIQDRQGLGLELC